jgi:hypothetical protein
VSRAVSPACWVVPQRGSPAAYVAIGGCRRWYNG